jgi:hypothetical protein
MVVGIPGNKAGMIVKRSRLNRHNCRSTLDSRPGDKSILGFKRRYGGPVVGDWNQNIARDNAHVGMQIGRVEGNAAFSSGESVVEQLRMLQAALIEAHRDGRLEPSLFVAARTELAQAVEQAPAPGQEPSSGFVVAMRKLAGLVGGAAELARAVTAVITIAQGAR